MRGFYKVEDKFKKYENAETFFPKRATKYSAGYDFYSPIDITIKPNTMEMIWTNIKAEFNQDEVFILCVTSGMGKYGIMLANTIGVIDSDYFSNVNNDGNIGFRLYNFSNNDYVIKAGDKIGQGIFTKFLTVDNEVEIKNVRQGGFGSTVKK